MQNLKLIVGLAAVFLSFSLGAAFPANPANRLPQIEKPAFDGFEEINGVIKSGFSDWSQAIGIAHNLTLFEAITIAQSMSEVTYFFYIKTTFHMGAPRSPEGDLEMWTLWKGDTIFFTGATDEQQWTSTDNSSVYIRRQN